MKEELKEVWGVYRDTRIDSIGRRQKHGHLWEVSTNGNIRIDGEIQIQIIKFGYLTVKNHFVHRIVAITHIPNPEHKPEVDHINGNPFDNRVENLRWVTSSENKLNPITRKRNSEAHHYSEKTIKLQSEAQKNRKHVNNGIECRCVKGEELQKLLDDGWVYGELKKSRILKSESKKNRKFVNNGIECRCVKGEELNQLLDDGWVYGRLKKS